MSEDLFGTPVDQPASTTSPTRPKRPVNDMNTIMKVIERALSDEGYVLVGPTGQVHRRNGDRGVTKCIWWEANAVHQLIESGMFKTGGYHSYDVGATTKAGQSVLVPQATRKQLARWKALAQPSTWGKRKASA